MKLLAGVGRKLSIPVLTLAIIGWILFIIGFGLVNSKDNVKNLLEANSARSPHRSHVEQVPYWVVIVAGPIFFLNAFIHLIFARCYTGIINSFFTSVHLVCGGAVVYKNALVLFSSSGRGLRAASDALTDPDRGLYILLEWVGGLAFVVFVTLYMIMWVTYVQRRCSRTTRADDQASPEPGGAAQPPTYSELDEVEMKETPVEGAGQFEEEAGQIKEEAGQTKEGAGQIKEEAGQLEEEAGQLKEGAGQLEEEAGQLDS